MLVGILEELEVHPNEVSGVHRVVLRHRDEGGRVYTVSVDARQVVAHDLQTTSLRRQERTVFRFANIQLAALMDGEVLRLCRRESAQRFLQTERKREDRGPPEEGAQLY